MIFQPLIEDLIKRFPRSPHKSLIIISIHEQKLYWIEDNHISKEYSISSAKAGTGNLSNSYKTPLGVHCISEKIGNDAQLGSIFKARVNTHKIATILSNPDIKSESDNITSRILWLSGMEENYNKGGNVDSHKRYIYIHGTDEEGLLGKTASHGCIRMSNIDVIELFNRVSVGTLVSIVIE